MQRRLAAYIALLAGPGAILLAHWPGRLNVDSGAMLAGARGDLPIVDHWSPTLTWTWQIAYSLFGLESGGVFLLQTVTFAAGVYLVLRSCFSRVAAALLTTVVLMSPPAFGFVGLVGRDAWFLSSAFLVAGLAVGGIRWTDRRARQAAIVGGCIAAAIAIAARQNGFTAVAPLLVGLAVPAIELLRERRSARRLTRRRLAVSAGAAGVGATMLILVTVLGVGAMVRDRAAYPETYTYLYDLGYLTRLTDEQLIPRLSREALPVQTPAEVRERWRSTSSTHMRADPNGRTFAESGVRALLTRDEAERLAQAWRDAVREHPLDYLRGRLGLWTRQIGIRHTPPYAWAPVPTQGSYGYEAPAFPALSDLATDYASRWAGAEGGLGGGALHHAWAYLLV